MKYALPLVALTGMTSSLFGCDTFASPAELDRPQILAIRSEPASIALGETAQLSLYVADSDGPVVDPAVVWTLQEQPGFPALGALVDDGEKVTFTAPDEVPSLPAIVTVEARVEHELGELIGIKAMVMGGPMLQNPVISRITVNGQEAEESLSLPRDSEIELAVEVEGGLSDDGTVAWYARPGGIDSYRSTPTIMLTPDSAEAGWLHVVVRDRGGIAFRSLQLRVE